MLCCQAARPVPRDFADPLCTGVVYLSESSSAKSSDKLCLPQPGGHLTGGSLTFEHVEEFFAVIVLCGVHLALVPRGNYFSRQPA